VRISYISGRPPMALLALFGIACAVPPGPAISITSPANGDRVSGRVTLAATTAPNAGVDAVEFVVDAVSVGTATSAPFSLDWDSSTFVGKTVTVRATARTTSGSTSISPPVVFVVASGAGPLPLGKESIYALVNEGALERADELLQDVWDIGPRSKPVYLNPITWTEDPYQDHYWRLLFYSLRPTSNLLWAYYTTGDVRYRDKLLQILSSYCANDKVRAANALTFDENYTTAFRAMVLVNSYVKLKRSGDLTAQLGADLLTSIDKLGTTLGSPLGYTGSYGNHGFTSAAALVLIAENFALPFSPKWSQTGFDRLNQLIVNTVDSDGVELENSPFYHFYVLSFAQQLTSWAQRWGVALPPEFASRTDAMSTYGAFVLQPDLAIPLLASSVTTTLGDLDPAVRTDIVARDPEFAYVASRGAAGTEPTRLSHLFPQSGQSTLRSSFGPPEDYGNQTFATFNVGPWRNAHNHLDVLGLTYFSEGRELLVDSGLFTYAPGPEHDYFTGTRAHNAVVVDGQDQGKSQLVFAGLTTYGPGWSYQSGSHLLYPGVTHQRAILILRKDLALIVDRLTSAASHDYVQTWHLAPDLQATLNGLDADAIDQTTGTSLLSLVQATTPNLLVTTTTGSSQPIQGWSSQHYGVKVPNVALEYRQTGPSVSFVTLLASGPFAGTRPLIAVDQNDAAAVRVRVCAGTFQEQLEIDGLVSPSEAVLVSPLSSGCQ
jgi:hypothetical protein